MKQCHLVVKRYNTQTARGSFCWRETQLSNSACNDYPEGWYRLHCVCLSRTQAPFVGTTTSNLPAAPFGTVCGGPSGFPTHATPSNVANESLASSAQKAEAEADTETEADTDTEADDQQQQPGQKTRTKSIKAVTQRRTSCHQVLSGSAKRV